MHTGLEAPERRLGLLMRMQTRKARRGRAQKPIFDKMTHDTKKPRLGLIERAFKANRLVRHNGKCSAGR